MGCDIHCWVEKRVDGAWALVPSRRGEPGFSGWADEAYGEKNPGETEVDRRDHNRYMAAWHIDRNYALFGILAGVRRGEYRTVVEYPVPSGETGLRGWPEDRCPDLKDEQEDHSGHWLLLSELNAFDWQQTIPVEGRVALPDYLACRQRHDIWAYPVGSEVSKADADAMLASATGEAAQLLLRESIRQDPRYHGAYVTVTRDVPYAEHVPEFVTQHLPALNATATREGVGPQDLRLLFYFDS
jgi:hypothetical protein